ncbi:MYG1 exonuclease-like isoform X1 [Watersipora subatra]|uniref:MYG1 exonuclease-like isoform X1 n=1 Tax=Watersipora subatra TaxID=2589382 RepID=UPI00355B2F26
MVYSKSFVYQTGIVYKVLKTSFPLQRLRFMSLETSPKKRRLNMKIGTHNGTFHCDDALAVWMLKQTKEFGNAEVIRTRTPKKLDECDIVVDVGAVFDHAERRYDHHQREFKETYNSLDPSKPWTTKLSSAGLVYVYYGKEIIKNLMERNGVSGDKLSDELVGIIADKVYANLIEEIDAVDNGISQTDGTTRYKVTTTISQRVANLNPFWNAEISDEIMMKRFERAMELVGAEMMDRVSYYQLSWLPGRTLVQDALEKRYQVHESGEIISFPQTGIPWKEHMLALEEELGVSVPVKYVLYEDATNKRWRVQCVPVRSDSFENRLSLPADWCGVRDNELSELTGIPGCVFVHANGFIGGNETYQGVLKMATESLRIATQN